MRTRSPGSPGAGGDHDEARELFAGLAEHRARVLGLDHRDTRRSHLHHAYETHESGDHASARDGYADLLRSAPVRSANDDLRFLRLQWARSQVAADPLGSLRATFNSGAGEPDLDTRPTPTPVSWWPRSPSSRRLLGETTGAALVDLVLEARRGSDQALTRLPEGLRNALPLLPDPPARDPAESGPEDSEDSALIHRWPP